MRWWDTLQPGLLLNILYKGKWCQECFIRFCRSAVFSFHAINVRGKSKHLNQLYKPLNIDTFFPNVTCCDFISKPYNQALSENVKSTVYKCMKPERHMFLASAHQLSDFWCQFLFLFLVGGFGTYGDLDTHAPFTHALSTWIYLDIRNVTALIHF